MSVDAVLEDRKKVYGDYGKGVDDRNDLLVVIEDIYLDRHKQALPAHYRGYFWDICNKLVRVANQPDHQDSWVDIQGYSQRILEDIQKRAAQELSF